MGETLNIQSSALFTALQHCFHLSIGQQAVASFLGQARDFIGCNSADCHILTSLLEVCKPYLWDLLAQANMCRVNAQILQPGLSFGLLAQLEGRLMRFQLSMSRDRLRV